MTETARLYVNDGTVNRPIWVRAGGGNAESMETLRNDCGYDLHLTKIIYVRH